MNALNTKAITENNAIVPTKISTRRVYFNFFKRGFDLFLAILLLPTIIPVLVVLWALTRLDGGPGFFGHKRVGRGGAPFRCWKIRTMVPGAEEKLKTFLAENPEARAEWERDFKLEKDPRITRLGNFLRKSSLDELPQIWNVIKGEMSFVGPRPIVEQELPRYGVNKPEYLAMVPGITGLWQVSGRNDISYGERVALDVDYLRRCSLWLDCKIILMTGASVLGATGK